MRERSPCSSPGFLGTKACIGDIICRDSGRQIVGPTRKRSSFFARVAGAIVNASDTGPMPAAVIENGFGDVRRHGQIAMHHR